MPSVIFINGTINSGKTTIGAALSRILNNCVHIDGDDHGQRDATLEDKIQAALSYIEKSIRSAQVDFATVSYPLREDDFARLSNFCTEQKYPYFTVTLSPPIETALSNRGMRLLKDWERERIIQMYNEGYHERPFSDLFIDNTGLSPEQTASLIAKKLTVLSGISTG